MEVQKALISQRQRERGGLHELYFEDLLACGKGGFLGEE